MIESPQECLITCQHTIRSRNIAGSLTSQVDEVIVLQTADSLELTTDVELAGGVEEVLDGRVSLVVVTEDLCSLESPLSIELLAVHSS